MTAKFPTKILVTGARAPVAVHIARLLGVSGTSVILADTFDAPISTASHACSLFLELPSPRFALDEYRIALLKIISENGIQAIIPTCEEVFFLAQIQQDLPIPVMAPDIALLAKVHNKYDFIKYVKQLGLSAPDTCLLCSKDDVENVRANAHHLVFKPVWSRFASDVMICPSQKKLTPLSPTAKMPWVAQDFIEGTEISVYAVARQGQLVALSAYCSLYRAGKGAGICFKPINEPMIRNWVTTFVNASNWEGQVSFDMILTKDRRLFPLECNPRATSGLHFFQNSDAFSQALWAGGEVRPDTSMLRASRLAMWVYGFPKALISGQFRKFFKTLRGTPDILDWPGDPGPKRAQLLTLLKIIQIALRNRISIQRAATQDIEWNGPD